jgi:hypothetical protein
MRTVTLNPIVLFTTIAVLTLGLSSSSAHAQEARIELGFFDGDGVTNLSPLLDLKIETAQHTMVLLGWGLTYTSFDVGDSDDFGVGNPLVGLSYTSELLDVGIAATIPLASVDDLGEAVNYGTASAMRGFWDAWLWLPETLTIVAPAQLRLIDNDALRLQGDAALALAISVGDDSRSDDTEILAQLGGEAAAVLDQVELGGRLAFAYIPSSNSNDDAQLSLEPFVALRPGGSMRVRLGLLLNLDEPAGTAFDDGAVWALRASLAGEL